jgi:phosphatidylserine/phosphatidylglycerophosphate/cardiolipin synthase-like enzyme
VCIIDDRWASVGSDNFNRRSWTSDSEIACAIQDERAAAGAGPRPADAFPLVLRRLLVSEHLGLSPDEVPDDPVVLFDAMVASAQALDAWFAAAGRGAGRGVREWKDRVAARTRRSHGRRSVRARTRAFAAAGTFLRGSSRAASRPAGRLRGLEVPRLTGIQLRWAALLYPVFDPHGPSCATKTSNR